jgi:NADP-dependent 3-hydroxy acid dehydrogenase YdfG
MGIGSQLVRISGSRALLTGASGGLGGPIARALVAAGAQLVLSGRGEEQLAALAEELGAEVLLADLASSEQTVELAQRAGDVDLLVANAALPAAARLEQLTLQESERAIDVNLRAPVLLAQALLPGMLSRRRGHMVFMSSIGGLAAAPGNPLYHATKFGLRGFAGAMRIDLHGSGVSSSCVLPGFISEAGLFAESGASLPRGVGTRTPRDVADAVIRAVEDDVAEIKVAPLGLRAGTVFWGLAPDLAASSARRLGSEQIAATYEQALREKR